MICLILSQILSQRDGFRTKNYRTRRAVLCRLEGIVLLHWSGLTQEARTAHSAVDDKEGGQALRAHAAGDTGSAVDE